jgi:anti-sigma regulatory factor (Ser/Thr protein kinase)
MTDEPRKTLTASLLAQALETGQLIIGSTQGPRWRSFLAAPESVAQARRFTESALAEVTETDPDHVEDVVLIVSELVTNAVREVARLDLAQDGARPVHLGVGADPRWTHLYAVDPAPALPKESHEGPLAGSGRGIPIIKSLAAMTWVELSRASKTIHVVVTRTGVQLTPEDRQSLNP